VPVRADAVADVPVRGAAGWADTTAAAVTTPTEAAATVSRPIACRAGPRGRAGPRARPGSRARPGVPALEMLFARLLAARMLLALMSLLPPPMAVPYVYFPSA